MSRVTKLVDWTLRAIVLAAIVGAIIYVAMWVKVEADEPERDRFYPVYLGGATGPLQYIVDREDDCHIWMGDREDRPLGRNYCQ